MLVQAVIDGDTIRVSAIGRVRLLGIDAPEVSHGLDSGAPFGQEAKARLTSILLHRWIRLEQDGRALDVYRRHLAYVLTEDGVFVNELLVREGLARVSAREALTRLPALQRAQGEAQRFRRGMWGATPALPLSGYTRPRSRKQGPETPTRSRRPRPRHASHPR